MFQVLFYIPVFKGIGLSGFVVLRPMLLQLGYCLFVAHPL